MSTTILFTQLPEFWRYYDADPLNALELDDAQKQSFLNDCLDVFLESADSILAEFGAYIYPYGDIYVPLDDTERLEREWDGEEGVHARISESADFTPVIRDYIDIPQAVTPVLRELNESKGE